MVSDLALDTAVLDIDGTLLDSNYHHSIAWSRAFAHVGQDVPVWRIHRAIGMGGDRLVAAVAGDDVEERYGDQVRDRWEQEFDAIIEETTLLDGAAELLEELAARGLDVVLASSSIPRHAEHPLQLLDAKRRASGWTTSEDAEDSKPDPDLIERALERVGARRAVMIGDAVWDVEAAERAGLPTICVLSGGVGAAELLAAGAIATYDGPRDLVEHLDEALARAVEHAARGTGPA